MYLACHVFPYPLVLWLLKLNLKKMYWELQRCQTLNWFFLSLVCRKGRVWLWQPKATQERNVVFLWSRTGHWLLGAVCYTAQFCTGSVRNCFLSLVPISYAFPVFLFCIHVVLWKCWFWPRLKYQIGKAKTYPSELCLEVKPLLLQRQQGRNADNNSHLTFHTVLVSVSLEMCQSTRQHTTWHAS